MSNPNANRRGFINQSSDAAISEPTAPMPAQIGIHFHNVFSGAPLLQLIRLKGPGKMMAKANRSGIPMPTQSVRSIRRK